MPLSFFNNVKNADNCKFYFFLYFCIKKLKSKFVILSILFVLASACGNVKKARQTADLFFEYRQKKNFVQILNLCSKNFIDKTDTANFLSFLKKEDSLYGKLISFHPEKIDYHKATDTFPSFATFKYKLLFEKKIVYDSIGIIKNGDKFEILFVYE